MKKYIFEKNNNSLIQSMPQKIIKFTNDKIKHFWYQKYLYTLLNELNFTNTDSAE